jgi:hypothetical protein
VEVLKDEYKTNLMYAAHVAKKPNTIFTYRIIQLSDERFREADGRGN